MSTVQPSIEQTEDPLYKSFCCPVNGQLMRYPVLLFPSLKTIDESAAEGLENCPVTGQPVTGYVRNESVQASVLAFVQERELAFNEDDFETKVFAEGSSGFASISKTEETSSSLLLQGEFLPERMRRVTEEPPTTSFMEDCWELLTQMYGIDLDDELDDEEDETEGNETEVDYSSVYTLLGSLSDTVSVLYREVAPLVDYVSVYNMNGGPSDIVSDFMEDRWELLTQMYGIDLDDELDDEEDELDEADLFNALYSAGHFLNQSVNWLGAGARAAHTTLTEAYASSSTLLQQTNLNANLLSAVRTLYQTTNAFLARIGKGAKAFATPEAIGEEMVPADDVNEEATRKSYYATVVWAFVLPLAIKSALTAIEIIQATECMSPEERNHHWQEMSAHLQVLMNDGPDLSQLLVSVAAIFSTTQFLLESFQGEENGINSAINQTGAMLSEYSQRFFRASSRFVEAATQAPEQAAAAPGA